MIRIIDIIISSIGILILCPLFFILYLLNKFENKSSLFLQERIGINMRKFTLIKFRTMVPSTTNRATHLVDPNQITNFGKFLRRTKLDEIPQLWNVLKGDMSMVGPRPCLTNQIYLIKNRKLLNIHKIKPGITGLAQIKGIDMSNPDLLVKVELEMIRNFSIRNYFYFLFKTFIGSGQGDRVKINKY